MEFPLWPRQPAAQFRALVIAGPARPFAFIYRRSQQGDTGLGTGFAGGFIPHAGLHFTDVHTAQQQHAQAALADAAADGVGQLAVQHGLVEGQGAAVDEATEDFHKQSDGSWIVLGSASVDDLFETLGLPEDEDIDSNTVNGLVQEKTCHLPKVGDRFTLGGYDGVVTRTAKRRVTEVRLTPAKKPEPEKDDDEKSHYGRMTSK